MPCKIRHTVAQVAANSRSKILKIFDRLSISVTAEDFDIVACSPMAAVLDQHQTKIERTRPGLKNEVATRLSRLKLGGRVAIRRLELRDSVAAGEIYINVRSKLYGRKGIKYFRLVEDQVIVHVCGEAHPREIETAAQLRGSNSK